MIKKSLSVTLALAVIAGASQAAIPFENFPNHSCVISGGFFTKFGGFYIDDYGKVSEKIKLYNENLHGEPSSTEPDWIYVNPDKTCGIHSPITNRRYAGKLKEGRHMSHARLSYYN